MNTLGERTKHVLKLRGIKVTEIADFMGKSQASISSYIINRAYPSGEFFMTLKRLIPDLNLNWLICGSGDMFQVVDNTGEVTELKRKLADLESREREMTTALMSMSRLIGKGESAKFETVCDNSTGVVMEKVNGRWSFASKHAHEHTVRFAV